MQNDSTSVDYRDIEGFPGYRVGDDGTVWSKRCSRRLSGYLGGFETCLSDTWTKLKTTPDKNGYRMVKFNREGKQFTHKVHALVLTAFRGPRPIGYDACHNDGDPSNNRLNNLRWGTKKSNQLDRIAHGTLLHGERCHMTKLTAAEVREIREAYPAGGVTMKRLGMKYGVCAASICHIVKGQSWRHLPNERAEESK